LFTPRFGTVSWRTRVDKTAKERSDEVLKVLMEKNPVDVVLIDTGRLRTGSLVWAGTEVSIVLSLDGWRGPPPVQWNTRRMKIRHDQLGGVTEGEFTVHITHKGEFAGFNWCANLKGVPARLRHVLECTGTGKKVPIPTEIPKGWTQDGQLQWEDRFDKVMTPTVFDKTRWVVRRLGLKELKSVLDVPAMMDCGTELRAKLKGMKAPWKIYVCLLDEVRRAFEKRRHKRPMRLVDSQVDTRALKEENTDKQSTQSPSVEFGADGETRRDQERKPTNSDKAVKADDALVPTFLWNREVCGIIDRLDPEDPAVIGALDVLRGKLLLPYWKVNVVLSLTDWLRDNKDRMTPKEYEKCKESGRKSMFHMGKVDWWKWRGGSHPFFWRWPEEFQTDIRDGLAPRFKGDPPSCQEKQRVSPDPDLQQKEKEKISKVINFGYLMETCWMGLKSLMHFFSVGKGDTDIRVVYNGTKSGLNAVTWIPWFAIPSSATLERVVVPGNVQADNDIEDMFLNFNLHKDLQDYTGVDVSGLFGEEFLEKDRVEYVKWDRPAMGLTVSLYTCFQGACRGKRVSLGRRADWDNMFHSEDVVTNLPGTMEYDPTQPRIYKRIFDGRIAANLVIYIDDVQAVANLQEEAWRASSKQAKTCSWLDLQDAALKRREASTEPGVWAGAIVWAT
jgi:hypothetical protein